MSLPSDQTSLTSLWNPHSITVKGEKGMVFLSTCGAAQVKQSAAALPSSTPTALPLCFVWVFWPQRAPSRELVLRYPRGASWSRVADSVNRGPAARPSHSRVHLPGCGWARLAEDLTDVSFYRLFITSRSSSVSSRLPRLRPSVLCGDAHSPCHKVGLTQHALRDHFHLYHNRDDLSYESWAHSFSFIGQLVPVARGRHRRTLCRSSRITRKTRLCFEKHLKIMTVLLRQRNQAHWICHGDP